MDHSRASFTIAFELVCGVAAVAMLRAGRG
jgi:hypothetical protein